MEIEVMEVDDVYDAYVHMYGKDIVDARIRNGKCLKCGQTKSESEISSFFCSCQSKGGHWIKSSEKEDEKRLSIDPNDFNLPMSACDYPR